MPKAAVAGLTRALAVDHAGEGIRVNAVRPGPIFTRFHERRATTAGKEFEDFKAEFGRSTMLKRPGTPREVAACILLLASDEASYVTGTCSWTAARQQCDRGVFGSGAARALRARRRGRRILACAAPRRRSHTMR